MFQLLKSVLFSNRIAISSSYFPFQLEIFPTKCRERESIVHNVRRWWLWTMMLKVWLNSSWTWIRVKHSILTLSSQPTSSPFGSSRDAQDRRIPITWMHTSYQFPQIHISSFKRSSRSIQSEKNEYEYHISTFYTIIQGCLWISPYIFSLILGWNLVDHLKLHD